MFMLPCFIFCESVYIQWIHACRANIQQRHLEEISLIQIMNGIQSHQFISSMISINDTLHQTQAMLWLAYYISTDHRGIAQFSDLCVWNEWERVDHRERYSTSCPPFAGLTYLYSSDQLGVYLELAHPAKWQHALIKLPYTLQTLSSQPLVTNFIWGGHKI